MSDRPTHCECGQPITQPETGRPRRWCSDSCRKHEEREAKRERAHVADIYATQPPPPPENWRELWEIEQAKRRAEIAAHYAARGYRSVTPAAMADLVDEGA
jgi:hypothetical protein